MKNLLRTTALFVAALSAPALATDDFGARFTDQAPLGFSDVKSADDAFNIEDFDPNAIEPAAGDEAQEEPVAEEVPSAEQPQEDDQATPEEISL